MTADHLAGSQFASPASCEPWWQTLLAGAIALGVVAGFLYYFAAVLVPVHPGVDQNGYLVGAKQIAATGTMKLRPTVPGTNEFDSHQNVGRMWVGAELSTDRERYYPKYPIGLPLIYAIGLLAGGTAHGVDVVYWTNPVAMAVAAWMTFLLGRRVTGSIGGLVAMLLFVTAPVTLALTTNPNSHATAVCCVVSGMYFLFTWLERGGAWRALLAGFFCGYAVTIRYTEGTLLLPLGLAGLLYLIDSVRQRQSTLRGALAHDDNTEDQRPTSDVQLSTSNDLLEVESSKLNVKRSIVAHKTTRPWKSVIALILGWLIPVGGLVIYNLVAMGAITGYDPTNESVGFSLEYAIDNWETMLRQLATSGLFFVMPLSVAGLVAMYFWNWRWALISSAWVLPCLVVYTFYYWAPDTSSVGYVRFFLTILPALCVAAAWTCRTVITAAIDRGYFAAAVVPVGLILAIATCAQLQQGLAIVETDHAMRLGVQTSINQISTTIPEGSTIFCGEQQLLHHLQFVRNDTLYAGETFNRGFILNLMNAVDMDEPQGLDPLRRASMHQRLKDLSQQQLDEAQREAIEKSLAAGRRVFYVLPLREGAGLPLRPDDPVGQRQWLDVLKRWQKANVFEVTLRGAWNVPAVRPMQERAAPRARRGDIRPDRRQGYWQILEVIKAPPPQPKPVATKPAIIKPAARPLAATKPAGTNPATTKSVERPIVPSSPTTRPQTTRPAAATRAAS